MALDSIVRGVTSGTGVEVAGANQLKVILETNTIANVANIGGVRSFSENDAGAVTGAAYLASPETDDDYRMRIANEIILDFEPFNYSSGQNTGKHTYTNTTMTAAWTAGQLTTNSGSITTLNTGLTIGTYATFGISGATHLYAEAELSFSSTPVTNTTIDFGLFLRGATTPYAPTDGAYFRLTAAGLQGVINYNGVETTTSVFSTFTITPNTKYQFILAINQQHVEFWINDTLYADLPTPAGQGQPFMSGELPFSLRHAIGGTAAGGVFQVQLADYTVSLGGPLYADVMSTVGNRVLGSYQGLSGGTMGSLANYANSATPTAAVATNTTAALGTGLGGQFYETATIAVGTDGIICSYQVPALVATNTTRRLRINGVFLSSYVQTALTGGPLNIQYSLAFGHTSVSMATTESANTKAPRRLPLPPFTQTVTAAQAVNTAVPQGAYQMSFVNPVFVNPGEFVAIVAKKVGTVLTAGVLAHVVAFDYGWE